ncbi:MAG: hypothetical protein ACOYEP_08460, partial [Limnochordia bacterium]
SGFCTVTKRNVKVLQEPYTDPYVRFCERADAAPDQRSVTLLDMDKMRGWESQKALRLWRNWLARL